jgi:MFS transporter, ACS family, aldohexuronate transporter
VPPNTAFTSPPRESEAHASALRWLMISLVFAATVINYLDRQTLSVMAPVLNEEFHMSNEAYSRIVFAFMLAYTVMNAISGPIIDRLGTKRGYAWTVVWWSAAEMLHGLSHGPLSMGLYRFLLGFGEAGNWPAGVKVVAEWFPVKERALGAGIFNSGSSVGAVIAAPVVAWIVLEFGWRPAFACIGALGFVWVAVWLAVYRSPQSPGMESLEPPLPVRRILSSRFLWQFTLSKVFSDPVWYFYTFWFPQYLKTGRGFDLRTIGELAWIPFFTAGLGNLLGGVLARSLLRKSTCPRETRKLIIVGFSLLMTAGIPAGFVHTATQSIALVSIATLGYTGALANLLAVPADLYPKNTVGSVWGLASTGAGFGGMIFSLLTGWMVDRWSFTPVFVLFGVIPIISALLIWRLPDRAD